MKKQYCRRSCHANLVHAVGRMVDVDAGELGFRRSCHVRHVESIVLATIVDKADLGVLLEQWGGAATVDRVHDSFRDVPGRESRRRVP